MWNINYILHYYTIQKVELGLLVGAFYYFNISTGTCYEVGTINQRIELDVLVLISNYTLYAAYAVIE